MGININGLRFLLYAKQCGTDYSQTAMIGRQGLHLSFDQFKQVFVEEFLYDLPLPELKSMFQTKYAEGVLEFLGAKTVHSFDVSTYEGCTHTHDFNLPIDPEFHQTYSCIIDGGSLEHIFNFPTAVVNCMNMVAQNGHFLTITPANNYLGHGLYQFSPELFQSLLMPVNGYDHCQTFVHEGRDAKHWYKVNNPIRQKGIVNFSNNEKTLMLVMAQRTEILPLLQKTPVQDYELVAQKGNQAQPNQSSGGMAVLKKLIPVAIKRWLLNYLPKKLPDHTFRPFYPHKAAPHQKPS